MHISDGVLSLPLVSFGWAVTVIILCLSIMRFYRMDQNTRSASIPKIAVMTAAFFTASLVELPIGPTSAHLVLAGLTGVILGPFAFISIFIALFLQAALFHFGGFVSLGVNSMNMGLCALLAYFIYFRLAQHIDIRISAGLAGGLAVLFGALVVAVFLYLNGSEFLTFIRIELIAHFVLAVIEGLITAAVVSFIAKIRPDLLIRPPDPKKES
ncbi:cobalt transporter CbiM [Methanosarcinaceae archaeon]|nr:cobalt transporter CbiM [Methanosarcinaceae archaeon]